MGPRNRALYQRFILRYQWRRDTMETKGNSPKPNAAKRQKGRNTMSYNNPENLAHVKSIAEQIEAVCAGVIYRDCDGTLWNCEDDDRYQCDEDSACVWEYDDDRDVWTLTGGRTYEDTEDEDDPREYWEQVSVLDYFSDCLDIEYRVSSPHDTEPRSVSVMVACGGPNIYVDTASCAVELYWWGDRASYPISCDAVAEIDAAFAELWNC